MPFAQRRRELHRCLGLPDAVLLFLGHDESPRNYVANPYKPFRQNSHFLYYAGLSLPGLALLSWPDGRAQLFGPPADITSIIWEGPHPDLDELAASAEASAFSPFSDLPATLRALQPRLHYLPPYQAHDCLRLAEWLSLPPSRVQAEVSGAMQAAIIEQRLIKTEVEIQEIEKALAKTASIFEKIRRERRPGLTTARVLSWVKEAVALDGFDLAFTPIITTHGEILHTHAYQDTLSDGDLLLVDMGTEAPSGYASDITRVYPATRAFSSIQREIYQAALDAQMAAIHKAAPGITYRQVHDTASLTIARRLTDLGLMKGDPEDAVAQGAHALFFPHGIGHMFGLDVHDMEDLGDGVGYEAGESRSTQFGLNFLRMARTLKPGYTATIEPGIYFIPALIDLWRKEGRHLDFLCYDKIQNFRSFGGIRIEDDILVTDTGCRVLGPGIAKTIAEIEA